MTVNNLDSVRLEPAGRGNDFVHDRATGRVIGRVWQESNGEWWATFYLGQGRTATNVSGGNFETQDAAVVAVAKAAEWTG